MANLQFTPGPWSVRKAVDNVAYAVQLLGKWTGTTKMFWTILAGKALTPRWAELVEESELFVESLCEASLNNPADSTTVLAADLWHEQPENDDFEEWARRLYAAGWRKISMKSNRKSDSASGNSESEVAADNDRQERR